MSPCPREGTQLLFAESMDEGYYCLISQDIKDERVRERERQEGPTVESKIKKKKKINQSVV